VKNVYIILVITSLLSCNNNNNKQPLTGFEGSSLPGFNLLLADSTTYFNTNNIPSDKPIVLCLLSPHCPYSRAMITEIIDNANTLTGIRFYVLVNGSFKEFKDFYSNYKLNKYNNVIPGIDYTNYFTNHFKVEGVPYLVIYNKKKVFKQVMLGKVSVNLIKRIAFT